MPTRRVHDRYDVSLPVTILSGSSEVSGLTRNVGLGGMFIFTDFSAQFGDRVLLRLRLPALREDSRIEATVRWVEPDGVGVQFGSLRAMEVWGLNQLLKARPLSD